MGGGDGDSAAGSSNNGTESIPELDGGNDETAMHQSDLPCVGALKAISYQKSLDVMKKLPTRDRRKLRYRLHLSKEIKKLEPWQQRARDVHWTQLVELMDELYEKSDSYIWDKPGMKHKEMHVPEETVAFMAGAMGMRENIWYVPIHNGCRVRVLDAAESEGPNRKVILSGSERVVELVANRILRAQSLQATGDPLIDIRKPPVPIYPSIEALRRRNLPVPLIRGVWDDDYDLSEKPVFLDRILPSHHTLGNVREFAEFVEDVTRAKKLPRFYQKYDPDNPEAHHLQQRIERTLVALFKNDTHQRLISTGALNLALSYLCKHEFLSSAREIFSKSEHLVTVDTFNILLQSTARRQDLAKFRDFLNDMMRMHIRPNTGTWLAFVDCLVSPPAKKSLINHILSKGYIAHLRGQRSLLQLTVEDSFLEHLESGQSVDAFLNKMSKSQETNWFNTALLNKMFSVIVRLKDLDALERLFDISLERGLAIDSSTLRQILVLFRSNVSMAVQYTLRCMNAPTFRLGADSYEKLFLIAFKARCYNICRVLWRYACINGFVSFKMKQSVLVSLARHEPHKKKDIVSNLWSVSAGKIIVGLDLKLPDLRLPSSILDYLPPEFHEYPLAYLLSGHNNSNQDPKKAKTTRSRLASDLVYRDIKMGMHYYPQEPLGVTLEAASVMDNEWWETPRPTQWMVQNAIQVPVVKRLRSPRW